MAVTDSELEGIVKGIPGYHPQPIPGTAHSVGLVFPTQKYTNPQTKEKKLLVLLMLDEGGKYIYVTAPGAFKADGEHFWETLKACMEIQWKTKLVQFEYNDESGEIRPMVEWPIEDGTLTPTQVFRAVGGLVKIVDASAPVLEQAARTGEFDSNAVLAG